MQQGLNILSVDDYGLLLFCIDQLPDEEARQLEKELTETYMGHQAK